MQTQLMFLKQVDPTDKRSFASASDSCVCSLCQGDSPVVQNNNTNKKPTLEATFLSLSLALPLCAAVPFSPLFPPSAACISTLLSPPSKPKKPRRHGDCLAVGGEGCGSTTLVVSVGLCVNVIFIVRIFYRFVGLDHLAEGVSVTNVGLANRLQEQRLSQHSLLILQSANQKLFRCLLS